MKFKLELENRSFTKHLRLPCKNHLETSLQANQYGAYVGDNVKSGNEIKAGVDLETLMNRFGPRKCDLNSDLCLVGQVPQTRRDSQSAPPKSEERVATEPRTVTPPPKPIEGATEPRTVTPPPKPIEGATEPRTAEPRAPRAEERTAPEPRSAANPPKALENAAPPRTSSMPDTAVQRMTTPEQIARGPQSISKPAESLPVSMQPTSRSESDVWNEQRSGNLAAVKKGGYDTVFYGDSITHALHLNHDFSKIIPNPKNLGADGDSTQHLLWRLQHGEADFKGRQPDKAVLLIGTNNLFKGQSNHDIARGIIADVDEMQKHMPNTKILAVGILPRGQSPHSAGRADIIKINEEVKNALQGRANVAFADIGSVMLNRDGTMNRSLVQGDYLHPTYQDGYGAMLKAIKKNLDRM